MILVRSWLCKFSAGGGDKKGQVWYSVLLAVASAFLVLTVSVAVPLVCRPFYYVHITALDLPGSSGHTAAEIREAYDEMMDFCMKGEPFGTGVLRWSESGMRHFADCAALFRLDFQVMAIAAVVLALCGVFYWKGYRPARFWGRGPLFWSAAALAFGFLVVAGFAAADFDRAFVIFHRMFFAGKDNWIFDPRYDEIINVLPEIFFRNCAILIITVMFALCIGLAVADIAFGFLWRRRGKGDWDRQWRGGNG